MINHLSIKNFAIIEDAEINFNKGLNIITGESGSGKSVVVEAMSLALGCRADSSYIRTGAEKAVIQMVAEYMHTEYVITRELSTNGKNICKINGEIVSLAQLQELTGKIADIHGQYDNQSLLDASRHLDLVDKYEKNTISPYKTKVSELYSSYKEITARINKRKETLNELNQKKELMEFEYNEIISADLIPGEDTDLNDRLNEEKNKEKVYRGFEEAYGLCSGEENSVLSHISAIQNALRDIKDISKDASELEYEFSDIYYRLDDIISRVRRSRDRLSYSSDSLDDIIGRLDTINSLKRKYGSTIDDILNYAEKLKSEINKIQNLDSDISSMLIEQERIGEMLKRTTDQLSELRKRSAASLEEKIQNELSDLMFDNAKVKIDITRMDRYTANGIDKAEFLISTNAGEQLKSLAKIASGGEMSRIMLAFKNIIGEYDGIGTMIFDEIDNGISGQTASVVGRKLLDISRKHQIISITHLPQIAALGNNNYKIIKESYGFTTNATIKHLSEHEKVEEIARLLSGDSITDIAMENAKALIDK